MKFPSLSSRVPKSPYLGLAVAALAGLTTVPLAMLAQAVGSSGAVDAVLLAILLWAAIFAAISLARRLERRASAAVSAAPAAGDDLQRDAVPATDAPDDAGEGAVDEPPAGEAPQRQAPAVAPSVGAPLGASKAQFLADMSHEVRTQLNGLAGMTEMLATGTLPPEQRRFAATVLRSSHALQAAVTDILDVAQLEAGSVRLAETEFDLAERLEEVVGFHAERAYAKGVELINDLAGDLPWLVRGDRARVGQALGNLIGSLLARADGGDAVVKARLRSREADHAWIRLEVCVTHIDAMSLMRDDGLSFLAPEDLASPSVGGPDHGLSIAKALVTLMGGTAGLDLKDQQGASLWLDLPFVVTKWRSSRPGGGGADLVGARVLLATHHELARDVLAGFLGEAGAQVLACAHADQVAAELKDADGDGAAYGVLVLDSELPGVESLAARSRSHALPPPDALPRVVLAPARTGWEMERAAGLSLAAYLPKPVARTQLVACIARLLGQDQAAEQDGTAPKPAGEDAPAPLGLKVLVADDNGTNQDTVGAMLDILGCEAHAVFDGQAALDAFQSERFDLVLMDCKMPLMDGYEATRRIRLEETSDPGRHTPVIALTAHAMEGDQARCQAAGMDDYLTKPISVTALRAVLLRWSRQRRLGGSDVLADADSGAPMLPPLGASEPGVEPLKLDDLDALQLLDPTAITEVNAISPTAGQPLSTRLIHSFLDSSPGLVASIRDGLDAGRPQAVAESAHSLRAAARILGATRMSVFCGRLEKFSAAGCTYFPPSNVIAALERIGTETRAAVAALLETPEAGEADGIDTRAGAASRGVEGSAQAARGLALTGDTAPAAAQVSDRERPLILVIDDSPALHAMAQKMLERFGLRFAGARDGRGGIEAVRFQRPDLILLDVLMPDMDGYETCRRLRRMPGLELVPILIMTGLEDTTAIECAYESGATDFYPKPINWRLLSYRIRYLLRGHATLDALHRSEARNSALIEAIPDVLLRLDLKGRLLQHKSARILEKLGARPDARVSDLSDLLPESVCAAVLRELEVALAEHGVREIEIELTDARGEPLTFDARLIAIDDQQAILLLRDMTERRQRQRVIHQLAFQDSLTGLANRQQFNQDLGSALKRARRREDHVALLYLDLDQFKRINDSLGHGVGDELLREAARRLQVAVDEATASASVRGGAMASTVARLGGDELTVILKGRGAVRAAGRVAEAIIARFREPFRCSERIIVCTVSIGIALSPQDGETPETLLKHADTALYAAKLAGRDTFRFFTLSMGELASRRLDIEAGLRRALEEQELRLHYQPIVDVVTGEILKVEALVRWEHPERGLLEPSAFIPIAEESGLILPVGAWVIDELKRQIGLWSADGFSPCLTLNLSDAQFSDQTLIDQLLSLRARHPRHSIELEITETLLLARDPRLIDTLSMLRKRGFGVAIDNFGTGYSSLALLKHLPIDTLKIDRVFIQEIGRESPSDLLVSTVIALGRGLGLGVVAEGVETAEQLELLAREGCYAAQGYFFSAPCPPEDLRPLLGSVNDWGGGDG